MTFLLGMASTSSSHKAEWGKSGRIAFGLFVDPSAHLLSSAWLRPGLVCKAAYGS
jgi:hypothetical protein